MNFNDFETKILMIAP